MKLSAKYIKLHMNAETYYVWVGGSCDYAHKERTGAGAYIIEHNQQITETYADSSFNTTEFRMMLTVMLHAMQKIPEKSSIVFLTNAAYIQNFDNIKDGASNKDLIEKCIIAKQRHCSVSVKILSYHKYQHLPETHEMAHNAMEKLRNK